MSISAKEGWDISKKEGWDVTKSFSGLKTLAAGFTALGLVATTGPLTGKAIAQDAQIVRTSSTTPVAYVKNPADAAREWRNDNRGGIAFAVYLGTTEELSPEQYRQGLTNVSTAEGTPETQFYFIQNDVPFTSFALYYDDMVVGPIGTRDIVQKTKDAASYQATNRRLFSVNDYDSPSGMN